MTTNELLTCQEVMRLTGIRSRTTIWRRIQKGRFPHPVDIGAGRIRWRAADIDEWISALSSLFTVDSRSLCLCRENAVFAKGRFG